MSTNKTESNSFYSYDLLQLYFNENNVIFLAMEKQPVKRVTKLPFDVHLEESTKERFIQALQKADISDGMSHLLQEGLLKELTV